MPVLKLSRRALGKITPQEKPITYFDTDLKGFGLVVRPSGTKSWIIEYRPGAGGRGVAKKRIVLGKYDDTMTPENARNQAATLLAEIRLGADPAAERADERAGETVKELSDAFLKHHIEPKRKSATADYYRQIFKTHINPAIGTKKASLVTRMDISRLHRRMADQSTKFKGQVKGGPYVANRMLAIVSSLYGWADRAGLVSENHNPAKGIEKYQEKSRERFLTSKEIDRLGAALREAETAGLPWKIDPNKSVSKHMQKTGHQTIVPIHVTAAIRLLMFTGCRLREILNLEWSNVDVERGVLFLPDSKTGKKTIVLAAPAMSILASLEKVGRYVIASESAGQKDERPRADLKRPWKAITYHAGLEGVRIHDLRHTFASFGAGSGLGLPVIGKLLGHKDVRTTQKYAHLAVDPMRRAADIIAGQIAGAMGDDCSTKNEPHITKVGTK
ncbi:MAG: integrase [Robiginitomaculum sp.]|nr:MAG: integrase [Robiginitomaculum sp.]